MTVKLLEREHAGKTTEAYQILDRLVKKHHGQLVDANIAIAWRFGWSKDADGRLKLGQAKKGSDLDRELHQYDFVILLNHEAWNQGGLNQKQKDALVDHELCHCEVSMDTNGEPKQDEQGRTVYRIRRHDIEEFQDVVARHGLYTGKLEEFAAAAINDAKRPILKEAEKEKGGKNVKAKADEAPVSVAGEVAPDEIPDSVFSDN